MSLTLPGAEEFAQFLEQQVGKPLVATKTWRVRRWGHWGKVWIIQTIDGVIIGEYSRFNPDKGLSPIPV